MESEEILVDIEKILKSNLEDKEKNELCLEYVLHRIKYNEIKKLKNLYASQQNYEGAAICRKKELSIIDKFNKILLKIK